MRLAKSEREQPCTIRLARSLQECDTGKTQHPPPPPKKKKKKKRKKKKKQLGNNTKQIHQNFL